MNENIPDKNLFMMCRKLNTGALSALPKGFFFRLCKKDELNIWKDMHFDDKNTALEYRGYMDKFFDDVYAPYGDLFFERCLFVCDNKDKPVATCFSWKIYDKITTLHWFKVVKEYENRGIGRALLSKVMSELKGSEYPVFLHTQPSSYRAIKLYTDFGFEFITDKYIGARKNELDESLPVLKKFMTPTSFEKIKTAQAPKFFTDAIPKDDINRF